MGKKFIRPICAAVLAGFVLTACSSGNSSSGGESTFAFGNFGGTGRYSFSESGLMYIKIENSKLKYFDFDSNQCVFLCGREGCTHNNSECYASVNIGCVYSAFMYDGYVYLVDSNLTETTIWKQNLDGTDRKQICTGIPGGNTQNVLILDGKVYLSSSVYVEPESDEHVYAMEKYPVLVEYNIDSSDYHVIVGDEKNAKQTVSNLCDDGEKIYYLLAETSEDMNLLYAEYSDKTNEEMMNAMSSVDCNYQLCSYDPATGQSESLFEENSSYGSAFSLWGLTRIMGFCMSTVRDCSGIKTANQNPTM